MLTVVDFSENIKNKRTVIASCICGNVKRFRLYPIRKGLQISCGCYKSKVLSDLRSTHKMTESKLYVTWDSMKQRSKNKKIEICEKWLKSFEEFHKDMGEKPLGSILRRVDKTIGFSKENCIWFIKDSS